MLQPSTYITLTKYAFLALEERKLGGKYWQRLKNNVSRKINASGGGSTHPSLHSYRNRRTTRGVRCPRRARRRQNKMDMYCRRKHTKKNVYEYYPLFYPLVGMNTSRSTAKGASKAFASCEKDSHFRSLAAKRTHFFCFCL